MGLNKGYLTAGRTAEDDEVMTPSYAVKPIIKYLKNKHFKKILCPFDKEQSEYVKILKNEGFEVFYSHLETKDFFDYTKDEVQNIDCIVSNPPFSIKDKILKKLYYLDKAFAILLPQNSMQSIERTELFIKYGVEYLGFDKRINFNKKGVSFASGYFCHNVLPEKLILEKLEKME